MSPSRRGSGSALLDQLHAEREVRLEAWSRSVKKHEESQPKKQTWKPQKVDIIDIEKTINDIEFSLGHLAMREIRKTVSLYFGVTEIDIRSRRRLGNISFSRHVIFYLCRHLTSHTLPEIARWFGAHDHTSILYGVRRIEALIKTDEKLAADIATLKEMLQL